MTEDAAVLFVQHADALRPRVDAALRAYAELPEGCPPRLREAILYSLLAPGKRLRPLLALAAAEASGGSVEAAMPAACAVEMIHAYSLIHDDLPAMDDDDLRRGRPTCHKVFGEALAILAGDALQAMAFAVLAREVRPPAVAAACCAALAEAAGPCNLVGGQADDILAEVMGTGSEPCSRSAASQVGGEVPVPISREAGTGSEPCSRSAAGQVGGEVPVPISLRKVGTGSEPWSRSAASQVGGEVPVPISSRRLESIHRRKTGALICASLRLGALTAGADQSLLEALDQYGRRVGLAFQITDDLLDVRSTQAATGKRTGKDAARGKLTFPGLFGVEPSIARAESLVAEACRALAPFGPRAEPLAGLARYVLARNR